MRAWIAGVMLVVLSACGAPPPEYTLPAQKWNDVVVEVETRPIPPKVGMNEFLILTTLERGKPVPDLLVSLRTDPNAEWRQAIQDGHSGVHRRALPIKSVPATLYMELRRKRTDEKVELSFPLNIAE